MSKESNDQLFRKREKIEYGIFGLIAFTLSLSIQFSPKMGNDYISILFLSWSFYFISFTISGLRLVLDLEYEILKFQNHLTFNLKRSIEKEIRENNKICDENREAFNRIEKESLKEIDEEYYKKGRTIEKLRKFLYDNRFLHVLFYYFGVLLNILFAALIISEK